jgi:hypothetical protein
MGILEDLFGTSPVWARRLPAHLRPPNKAQIEELEQIRKEAGKGHEEFFFYIVGHPATTRRLQRYLYRSRKQQGDSDEDALRAVLGSRVMEDWKVGISLFGIRSDIGADEFVRRVENLVRRYPNIEGLTEAILVEEEALGLYRPYREFLYLSARLGSRVSQILSRE